MGFVSVNFESSVATVTWSRPAKANAIGVDIATELTDALGDVGRRTDVEVCVLRSASGHFCAGWDIGDIASFRGATPDAVRAVLGSGRRLLAAVRDLPQVAIAAVTGAALGFGMSLLGRCDVVVSATDASFGYPEVTRGVVPVLVAPEAVALLGARVAKSWLLNGRVVGAESARAAGVPLEIVEAAELDDAVARIAAVAARDGIGRRTKAYLSAFAATPPAEQERFALDCAVENLTRAPVGYAT
jgi:isohexenylglutaconyl-CoA hydratase